MHAHVIQLSNHKPITPNLTLGMVRCCTVGVLVAGAPLLSIIPASGEHSRTVPDRHLRLRG